ncbi:MAG: phosphoribosylaminoimidazolesuccinocarboxamide synthase [Anaerolineales bacterium]
MIPASEILTALPHAIGTTDLPLTGKRSGKVRDSYSLGEGRRLFVTTDRLSAFDRILAQVPFKGQVLNQLAAHWFEQIADIIPSHVISVPDPNALMAVEAEPFPVEVVVRGYITGVTTTALWHRYSLGERQIYGYRFPEGLRKNQDLPEPIITPTTKGNPMAREGAGATGHDERLTCDEVVDKGLLDAQTWEQVQAAAMAIFKRGQRVAREAGLLLVDTKYEFGRGPDGEVLLIDEVHTPDSSRFWKSDSYSQRFAAGEEPENFDKEFVRLKYSDLGYIGDGQPPEMSDDLWVATSQRYIALFELLTGQAFQPAEYPAEPRLVANLRKAGILS